MSERTPEDTRCPACGTLHKEHSGGLGDWRDGAPVVCEACGAELVVSGGRLVRMNATQRRLLRAIPQWPDYAMAILRGRAAGARN